VTDSTFVVASRRPLERRSRRARAAAFTLVEVVTVALIVIILIVLLLPVAGTVQSRLERTRCIKNLQNLHVAANLYIQEHYAWPQIELANRTSDQIAKDWQEALQPYGITLDGWICPTFQKLNHSPDVTQPENRRIDYIGMRFAPKPQEPFSATNYPWFFEKVDVHGNGQLLIFSDGHVENMGEFQTRLGSPTPTPTPGH